MNLKDLQMLEFDELYYLLQEMSQQELDELQVKVLKKIKEIQEEILFNLNLS